MFLLLLAGEVFRENKINNIVVRLARPRPAVFL